MRVMMMVKLRMVIMMMGMMMVVGLLADGLQDKLARGTSSVSPVGCTGRNASLNNLGAAPHFCLAYLWTKCEEMLYLPAPRLQQHLPLLKSKKIPVSGSKPQGVLVTYLFCFSKPVALQVGVKGWGGRSRCSECRGGSPMS